MCFQGDGEKSPRQRRPSSPSSNSSLGGYGRYTPSRSPQNYSRAGISLIHAPQTFYCFYHKKTSEFKIEILKLFKGLHFPWVMWDYIHTLSPHFLVNDREQDGRIKHLLTVIRGKHLLQTSQMIPHSLYFEKISCWWPYTQNQKLNYMLLYGLIKICNPYITLSKPIGQSENCVAVQLSKSLLFLLSDKLFPWQHPFIPVWHTGNIYLQYHCSK